jgi:acetyltransferase-like isoleucine patch superfamily enzyme
MKSFSAKALINHFFPVLRSPARQILKLFFDSGYLQGRHFNERISGYAWAVAAIWHRNILRLGKPLPFPASFRAHIAEPSRLHFHADDLNNFQSPGTYFQNFSGDITIGKGTYIAPNVGIITANHDLCNLDQHQPGRDVIIGEACWIGMNTVILPGVVLGNRTIVGAGSVVTKSFFEGNVVIAGNPAKIIKAL